MTMTYSDKLRITTTTYAQTTKHSVIQIFQSPRMAKVWLDLLKAKDALQLKWHLPDL